MLNCRRQHGVVSIAAGIFAALLFAGGCGRSSDDPVTADRNQVIKMEMAALLDRIIENDKSLHGIVLRVEAPDRNLIWEDARGWADEANRRKMVAGDLFRVASIGKMTCAALAMRLVEKGGLGLDDKISRYLPPTLMNGLHVYQGTSYGDRITIRQLLGHTSGLADYVQDRDENSNGIPDFLERNRSQGKQCYAREIQDKSGFCSLK